MSLRVQLSTEGECLGLLGASGCGKSMTLKCIAGIAKPDSGMICAGNNIFFDSISRINVPARLRRAGYLFQNYALFPNMTVLENICAGVRLSPHMKRATGEDIRQEAFRLMQIFHIEQQAGQYPARLSGGQQQRTAFARLLGAEPDFLLLDEPFSALDGHLKEELQLEFRSLLKNVGKSSILVSHDRDEIYRLCRRTALMDRGRVFDVRDTKGLFSDPDTYMAARLTGCKNLLSVGRADRAGNRVYIPRWDMWIYAPGIRERLDRGKKIDYIGIRAHHFEPVTEEEAKSADYLNVLPIVCRELIEEQFEHTILFSVVHPSGRLADETIDNTIWMKSSCPGKEAPALVRIPPERILLLEKNRTDVYDKGSVERRISHNSL